MFKHHNQHSQPPKRVVILGAKGFVGSATVSRLAQDNIPTLGLSRNELNLLENNSTDKLISLLQNDDALVIISAQAPCKDHDMLLNNIKMMHTICKALEKIRAKLSQIIYISSDAVYADSNEPLTESSVTAPESLHGIMHLTREIMLRSVIQEIPFVILRPSLLYGASDPHNGYGPNRFRRLAADSKPIVLFGQGEERRDHVYIKDVAELIRLVLLYRSEGILNVATGTVISFREIAELVVQLANEAVEIKGRPRQGTMPHGGYRAFDITVCQQAFPNFKYTLLKDGLRLSQKKIEEVTV